MILVHCLALILVKKFSFDDDNLSRRSFGLYSYDDVSTSFSDEGWGARHPCHRRRMRTRSHNCHFHAASVRTSCWRGRRAILPLHFSASRTSTIVCSRSTVHNLGLTTIRTSWSMTFTWKKSGQIGYLRTRAGSFMMQMVAFVTTEVCMSFATMDICYGLPWFALLHRLGRGLSRGISPATSKMFAKT